MRTDSGWPILNEIAKAAEKEGDLAALADLERRLVLQALMRDFVEAHRPSLWTFIDSKMLLDGGVEKFFDGSQETRVLLIPMRFNPPGPGQAVTDIDPACAFTIRTCAFLPLARIVSDCSQIQKLWDSSEGYRQRLKDRDQGNPLWAGILLVLFQADVTTMKIEFFSMFKRPILQNTSQDPRMLMQRDTAVMNLGIVFRPRRIHDEDLDPGYLQKQGSVWRWKPLIENPSRDREWAAARGTARMLPLMEKRLKAIRKS